MYTQHFKIDKRFLLTIFLVIISPLCYTQVKNPENLSEAIDKLKNTYYRTIGLDNLDKVEGIYHFSVERRVITTFEIPNKDTTIHQTVYAAIIRDPNNEDIFRICQYIDDFGDFAYDTTDWFIKKVESKYIVTHKRSEFSTYQESNILFSGFSISYKTNSTTKGLLMSYETFNTLKKIYPTTLDDNIYKTGTGFFVSKDGYIITNYHVIENSENIYVTNKQFKRVKADVIGFSDEKDIALLKIDASFNSIPYKIVFADKDVGSNIFTLGYPLVQSMGQEVKLTTGIINSGSGFEDDRRYYQFSAEVQPGNSGGPLFDSEGNVIGLVTAKYGQATNVGYALKSTHLYVFIEVVAPGLLNGSINSLKSLSLSEKYKSIKDYIVLLEIE